MKRRATTASDPIPYQREHRAADYRRGREDGHDRLPSYTELLTLIDQGKRLTTPYTRQLIELGRHDMDKQLELFSRRTAQRYEQIGQKRAKLADIEEQIECGRDEITEARAPLTEAELAPRSPQEAAPGNRSKLLARRAAEREQRVVEAKERQATRVRRAGLLREEIAGLSAAIDREFVAAQSRARQMGDYYVVRVSGYWDGIVQTHPEGPFLAPLVDSVVPVLPDWIDATCVDGVIKMPSVDEPVEEQPTDPEVDP